MLTETREVSRPQNRREGDMNTTPETLEVGQRWWDSYWNLAYVVLDVAGDELIVQWDDGSTSRHATPLDPRDRFLGWE